MNKIIAACVVLLLLGGCAANDEFKPKTTVRLVTTNVYPELPNIEPVGPVNLIPWEADVPRDVSTLSVISSVACRSVGTHEDPDRQGVILPDQPQSDSWWVRCGENPILPNSNIFIGFNQQNWNIVQENFAKLRELIFRYQARIEEINNQRQRWREKADEERTRVNEEGIKVDFETDDSIDE